MGVKIQFSQSYYWLNSWILANVIQLATQEFCDRFVDYRMDPARLLYDQMVMAANALLLLCVRENRMLQAQIESQLEAVRLAGGFTENMTVERLEARKSQAAGAGAPACPKCGKLMLRRMQRKGQMQGREFWGCSDYPRCNGIRPIEKKQDNPD